MGWHSQPLPPPLPKPWWRVNTKDEFSCVNLTSRRDLWHSCFCDGVLSYTFVAWKWSDGACMLGREFDHRSNSWMSPPFYGFFSSVYLHGTSIFWYCIGVGAGIVLAGVFMVPVFFPLQFTSLYQWVSKLEYQDPFYSYFFLKFSQSFLWMVEYNYWHWHLP